VDQARFANLLPIKFSEHTHERNKEPKHQTPDRNRWLATLSKLNDEVDRNTHIPVPAPQTVT
jgi:hypothetical protein